MKLFSDWYATDNPTVKLSNSLNDQIATISTLQDLTRLYVLS